MSPSMVRGGREGITPFRLYAICTIHACDMTFRIGYQLHVQRAKNEERFNSFVRSKHPTDSHVHVR